MIVIVEVRRGSMLLAQGEDLRTRVERELTALVAAGASGAGLVAALADTMGCQVWIDDADASQAGVSAPIMPGAELLGVLRTDIEDADDERAACLDYAARVIGIELVRERAERETRWSLEADLLTELVGAAGTITESLRQRAEHAGFDLGRSWHVLLLEVPVGRPPDEVVAAARRPAISGERAMTCLLDERLAVAVCDEPRGARDAKVNDLHRIARGVGAPLRIGVSSPVTDFAAGLRQARSALCLQGASKTTYHDDMGSLRFLVDAPNRGELLGLVDEQIGPLARHDREHQAYLLETLEVYLDEGGNRRRTAERCHVHASTIKYRMRRIRELLGRDLSDADVRFDLMLALKILAVLKAGG
jgi:sugar diacid utilization regulator